MDDFRNLLDTPYEELHKLEMKPIVVDDRIDEECKRFVDSFNEILMKVYHPQMSVSVAQVSYTKSVVQRDFSQLVSPLSKVIERELNNSLVPFMKMDKTSSSYTIGEIFTSMKKRQDMVPEKAKRFFDEYEKELRTVRLVRNDASHTTFVDENRFLEFYTNFCTLLDAGWFTLLMDMKMGLK